MKHKLPKIKIFQILLSFKYLYVLIILIMAGILVTLGFFLYKNLYQTITQSEEIILLRQEVAPDTINMTKVNSVLESLNLKTMASSSADWVNSRNPFEFYSMPTESSSVPRID